MELRVRAESRRGDFAMSVDFSVAGGRFGLFGASGSGKSTLAALIAGLVRPDNGEIVFDGEPLFDAVRRIDVPPERRRIAIVFQESCLFPHLDVRSNLLYGFRRCPAGRRTVEFDALVDAIGMEELLDRRIEGLSGGERQRVALGRAVLASPRLLLMDEPLSSLDDASRFRIIPYLRNVSERFHIPYLFISHSLVEMRLMTDHVLVLEAGRVTRETTPDQLARGEIGRSPGGYLNLLALPEPRPRGNLLAYGWGGIELIISPTSGRPGRLFELSSKDIILCKRHPEAISARNLLRCKVTGIFPVGDRFGVELDCGGKRLVAEVVGEAVTELGIKEGGEIFALFKAVAFRALA